MPLLPGRVLAEKILDELRIEISSKQLKPILAAILVGQDPSSKTYIALKQKACQKIGVEFRLFKMRKNTTQKKLSAQIQNLNEDKTVHGILLQLPLPAQLNPNQAIQAIDPEKDADGFHPANLEKFLRGDPDAILSPVPAGIKILLESTGQNLAGKNALITSNSEIFSKPILKILADKNIGGSWKSCRDTDIFDATKNADIFVTACGKPQWIRGENIKKGAIIIDVGINKIAPRKIVGDVDIDSVKNRASLVSPVPGGVGPLTVAFLLKNVMQLSEI
ncbi:MAG: methylenetetrahydrofolate dehydrogenase (NADP+) / methenyltetrahydrofolate cyclohydrolase [Parcubacteria group bacterium Gr01-1014_18]|nr:MAG: methylenetetrahydrofolate dehydrogenase (NADP+) / methenyltetrahydrofolate cyclohydrolase [Parcubacteria group bacterium Greene0416_36]TSC81357.1 MAG: methylenetetrahydrofolate dehydrogenase (NADP+) / methenyltetrahydrofolate cyclohydrolase [Parcubacteria group bacterium Gr01-1014_18]TSC99457.1 MAG: methylenetetrahydrofolate dehydrogenase (NADP+) / methenyltetrahydrofolate cyclohydrolase [Parcubacteria group bacterium Greene1014_20]TSD07624.1 MAG: methylenetetrahydrofolate dehydrogenase 